MSRNNMVKSASAGLLAGMAGALAMDRFQELVSWLEAKANGNGGGSGGSGGGEPATVKAAEAVSERVFGHELSDDEKQGAGTLMHYAMGAASGMFYGALVERVPVATAATGAVFGAVIWAVADEGAVPALGLAKGPAAYPVSSHFKALASHVAYGVATELVRRAVMRVI